MKTIQWHSPGRAGQAMRRLAMAGYLVIAFGAHAIAQESGGLTAVDCSYSNLDATAWRMVTPLTSTTPDNAILYQRTVSLFVSFKYGKALTQHELVTAGHWAPGSIVTDGTAQTNVSGIGLQWAGVSGDSVERTLQQGALPMVTAKYGLGSSGGVGSETQIMRFRQYLVLTKPAAQLPQGKLVVKNLPGNPTVAIYAIDFPKGLASVGGTVTVPEQTTPPNLCKQMKAFVGVGNVCIGSECELHVPNRCEVVTNTVKSVTLGNFAISSFPAMHATSKPVNFDITLSNCAAAAKPSISFRDKAPQPNPDKTLLQLSAPAGQAVARGFNIAMKNELTGERIAYGEPGTATTYPMRRTGDLASIPLSAWYVRTGTDAELKPGYAGGGAEFSFTFP
ncbi:MULTISPECIES: fimbrial protein [Burkholderia]|uniref:Type 1 fimbrial protein n=1 Tax=Burkholderia contaminans TaxID=488447 RepID=A0A2S5DSH3_9BURK|nr:MULTISPECIES: fimbrial protein [Burkholderia]EKS9796463.1 type 1 fimbrial protein [Burkholderia cepacia]EKS9803289.1 type 1 fimbrial protein [Burkholderia cepacia]EKS9812893.1 type 1 fimbrial protein [Burkholderia cepacia]EKS9823377.1 type 1 fimbrial protein [Burkholderia cepacia]EKS9825058.1 type 1 fimbrial protein [Burkholderia cepacia]